MQLHSVCAIRGSAKRGVHFSCGAKCGFVDARWLLDFRLHPSLLDSTCKFENHRTDFETADPMLHFLRKSDGSLSPSMRIVSDIDDVFLPVREGIFVDPVEARWVIDLVTDDIRTQSRVIRSCIESLLDLIPITFEASTTPHVAAGAAIRGGLAALVCHPLRH